MLFVQLDAVFLRIVGEQLFLQLRRGDAGHARVACALKQHDRVLRGFIEQGAGFVDVHVAELHELLLQIGHCGIVVAELQRRIARDGDPVLHRRGRRLHRRQRRRRNGNGRLIVCEYGGFLRSQVFGSRVCGMKQPTGMSVEQKKESEARQNGADRRGAYDPQRHRKGLFLFAGQAGHVSIHRSTPFASIIPYRMRHNLEISKNYFQITNFVV